MAVNALHTDVDNRINRLSGQIEGIRRMIKSGRSSDEVAQQILAARQALSRIGILVLKDAILRTPQRQKKKIENLLEKIFRV